MSRLKICAKFECYLKIFAFVRFSDITAYYPLIPCNYYMHMEITPDVMVQCAVCFVSRYNIEHYRSPLFKTTSLVIDSSYWALSEPRRRPQFSRVLVF